MSDSFLTHYNRELLAIRRTAAEFAAEHPRIAGRLRLSADAVEDPSVGRLIESFAFLTARVRQKLDDDFPELTDALLGMLYPHYQRPIPSMSVLQVEPPADLQERYLIEAGAMLDTEPVEGETCRFRTAYPVELHPMRLVGASLASRPFQAPIVPDAAGAVSCLRLTLEPTSGERSFADIAPGRVRLFLRGQPSLTYQLYELLLNDALAVAFANGPGDTDPVVAEPTALRPVGFGSDEGLLLYPETAHAGYRLLTEFFVFPEKFLFVDLDLPEAARLDPEARRLEIFVFLKRSASSIERAVSPEAFALGCTPVVNLFPQAAEPIRLDQRTSEYRIVPDSRRQAALEVYSIDNVAISGGGRESPQQALPFYSLRHADASQGRTDDRSHEVWWLANQREGSADHPGTETLISLVDPDFDARALPDAVLSVDTMCLNRDLPERLPFGGSQPRLSMVRPSPAIAKLRLLTPPTPTLRNPFGQAGRWRLISHLALNHLSLVEAEDASAIRELLTLYDVKDSAETRALIDGVLSVSAKLGSARVRGVDQIAFCRGVDVEILFEDANFSGSSVFLLASILERFLGLYASVNSFSRLTARIKGRTGVLRQWPSRAGDRVLL
ncbi:type VI secretion system baseplate subunit TssF [Aureimonas pseudogalii]|uniref:Type VI secretion system protein ImpG n=1 Tax=Aureimonas pseudogalii TaxID=1744844 RepID=A0A7W6MM52_9HYPH|nr:type VI secretion system baseplate subunit TssF [Aureimonas pseudogalii]MBB4000439.1 type VI secretion system protein ImpG [Aureimonas pseudogalii]